MRSNLSTCQARCPTLGDALADDRGRGGIAALARRAQLRAHFLFGGGGTGQHTGAVVGNDARVDMQVGTVHRQARRLLQRNAQARLARAAQALIFLGQTHFGAPYFFFVSFSATFSSE